MWFFYWYLNFTIITAVDDGFDDDTDTCSQILCHHTSCFVCLHSEESDHFSRLLLPTIMCEKKEINKISKKVNPALLCRVCVRLWLWQNVEFVFVCSVNRENGFVYFYDLIITTSATECDYKYYCSSHFTFLPIETLRISLFAVRRSQFAIFAFHFYFVLLLFCGYFYFRFVWHVLLRLCLMSDFIASLTML